MLIDVSHFQADAGPIDYAAVKAKVAGAYIKLSQGTGYIDPAWHQHWLRLYGIPLGGYHFCGRMDNLGHVEYLAPEAEAQAFAAQLLKASWGLRPVVDIEAPGADPDWLKAFLTALRQASGIRRLRVYTSRALITTALNPNAWIDPDTDLWIARYNTTLGFDHPQLVLWQHTQSGHVPGIQGSVDLSVELNGWTPKADTAPTSGGFLMALTDAEQAEILAGIRALKPGVRLPARSPNCGVGAGDDAFGSALNAWARAADAAAIAQQALNEVRALRAQLTPPK